MTGKGALHVVAASDGAPLATMQLETENDALQPYEIGLALDERGEHVAAAAHGDPKIRCWSVAESRQVGEAPNHAFRLQRVTLSADNRTFGFACRMLAYTQPRPEMTSLCLAGIVWPGEVAEAIRGRLEPPAHVTLNLSSARWSGWPRTD